MHCFNEASALPDSSPAKSQLQAFAVVCGLQATVSSAYHLLNAMSDSAYTFLTNLDFAAIALTIGTSMQLSCFFEFFCEPTVRETVLPLLLYLSITTAVVCMLHPPDESHVLRFVRTLTFSLFSFSGAFAWLANVVMGHSERASLTAAPLFGMMALNALGALVYTFFLPERLAPGRFNVWCHSHSIMHLLAVGAGLWQFYGYLALADGVPCGER